VLRCVDWLVAVQVSPETAQERLGAAVLVLYVLRQFVGRDLIGAMPRALDV